MNENLLGNRWVENMRWIFIFGLAFSLQPVWAAESLLDIYALAKAQDSQLAAAAASRKATQEILPQAKSLLYPKVTLSAQTTDNQEDTNSDFGQQGQADFNSHGHQLSLVQPILHWESWAGMQQAKIQFNQADIDFQNIQQELFIRVAEAYFNVLGAYDTLHFSVRDKNAIARQRDQAKQRFELGLLAITSVHEAQSRYDLAVAREIAAKNEVDSALARLSEITNKPHQELATLISEFTPEPPDPADKDTWINAASRQNLQLQSADRAVENAQKQIERIRAGHLPTLDLVAQRRNSVSGGGQFGISEVDNDSLTLQMDVPIYSGGIVNSQIREARASFEKAISDRETLRRTIVRQVQDAYLGVIAGISEVAALKQAVVSSKSALEATQAGFKVGTRTIVDVLNAEGAQYLTERNYARSRYNYLLNGLRLKQAAGSLSEQDLAALNRYFE